MVIFSKTKYERYVIRNKVILSDEMKTEIWFRHTQPFDFGRRNNAMSQYYVRQNIYIT